MVDELGIRLIQMMKNAGANLASLAMRRFLGAEPLDKRVTILAGSGANGGGVLAAARHLHNRGLSVRVYTVRDEGGSREATAAQLKTLRQMGIEIFIKTPPAPDEATDLILDGIIGYNLKGAPSGLSAECICWANSTTAPVLSMDVPSGLDLATGEVFTPAIRATATMTLALPKKGLTAPRAREMAGEIYLADIGVPPEVYRRRGIGLDVGFIFRKESILRLG